MQTLRTALGLAGAALFLAGTTTGQVVINEVYYDAPGSDNGNVFVELYGPAGTDITGWSIVGIEGGSAASGGTCNPDLFTFPAFQIPADGFVVVADESGGVTTVANFDFLDSDMDLENGPDAVVLTDAAGNVVDAVAYGAIDTTNLTTAGCTGVNAGEPWFEGAPARDVFSPLSIERSPAGADTGDNDTDFTPNVPTPGTGADCASAIEWVNTNGAGSSLDVAAGEAVGLDAWFACGGGAPYLFLCSATDPGSALVPVVIDATSAACAQLVNVAPFVAWAGTLDGNGRVVGTASLDWAGLGVPSPAATVPIWVGAVALPAGQPLVFTNNVALTLF